MSRAKNAVTLKNKQGECPLSGLPTYEKWKQMRYGRDFDQAAYDAIHGLDNALFLKSSPPCPSVDKQVFDENRNKFWEYVAAHYEKSRYDGSFFRKLAYIVDVFFNPVDPAKSVIGGEIYFCETRGLPMPTVSQAVKRCKEADAQATRKTVERIFKAYEVSPTPEKRGPKLGTKQGPSVHRAKRN